LINNQHELQDILHLHQSWLDKKPWGKQGCLNNANLYNIDLSNLTLSGFIFHNTNLTKVNLTNTVLTNTIFVNANLYKAKLINASLIRSNLFGANLSNADLTNANLTTAILSGSTLHNAQYSINQMLMIDIQDTSDKLNLELMRWECSIHPNGKFAFDNWKKNKIYPFSYNIRRMFHFNEKRDLWNYSTPKLSLYKLWLLIARNNDINL